MEGWGMEDWRRDEEAEGGRRDQLFLSQFSPK
jgi:hypothetical protein